MRLYDKLAHAKKSVYQALIWIRPGYEARSPIELSDDISYTYKRTTTFVYWQFGLLVGCSQV